ncbi:Holliday junction resolvase RuvX, partial [Candidatus Poribacteria bacterium]|nr:Holliday junction resolvase RuvX [Candidatus Poribacteria bacterium]
MALDVGEARIGVAVSASWTIAATLPAIERRGRKQTLDALGALLAEHGIRVIVIGLPLLED